MTERFWRLLLRWFGVRFETYETDQPWVIYTYFVPDWLTRILGRTTIRCECAICGDVELPTLAMPRVGEIVDRGHHPERTRFLREHEHTEISADPILWARPLRNAAALGRGDLLHIARAVAEQAVREAGDS